MAEFPHPLPNETALKIAVFQRPDQDATVLRVIKYVRTGPGLDDWKQYYAELVWHEFADMEILDTSSGTMPGYVSGITVSRPDSTKEVRL